MLPDTIHYDRVQYDIINILSFGYDDRQWIFFNATQFMISKKPEICYFEDAGQTAASRGHGCVAVVLLYSAVPHPILCVDIHTAASLTRDTNSSKTHGITPLSIQWIFKTVKSLPLYFNDFAVIIACGP